MNEDHRKLRLGKRKQLRHGYKSAIVKPSGKFWKRLFNKKVRKGAIHKRTNWMEWC